MVTVGKTENETVYVTFDPDGNRPCMGMPQRRSDIRVPFGVPSGRVCIILYGYNGARDEKTKWRQRKFPSGISPE